MEVQVEKLFQIIGQKEYIITEMQAELVKQQNLNKEFTKKVDGLTEVNKG